MALRVQSSSASGTSSLSLSFSSAVTSGNLLTLHCSYDSFTTATLPAIPTDTGGTFSSAVVTSVATTSGTIGIATWFEVNAAGGAHSTVISLKNSSAIIHGTLAEWSGLLTSGVLDITSNSSKVNTNPTSLGSGTASTSTASELALICFVDVAFNGSSNIGLTNPPGGYSTISIGNNSLTDIAFLHGFTTLGVSGNTSVTFNWTDSEASQSAMASIATFKPSVAGSAVRIILPQSMDGMGGHGVFRNNILNYEVFEDLEDIGYAVN